MNSCGNNEQIIDEGMESNMYQQVWLPLIQKTKHHMYYNLWNISSYIFPNPESQHMIHSCFIKGSFIKDFIDAQWCKYYDTLHFRNHLLTSVIQSKLVSNILLFVLRIFSFASHLLLRSLCKRFFESYLCVW